MEKHKPVPNVIRSSYYGLYTIENGEEERKEILRDIVRHKEMVQLWPIFSEPTLSEIKNPNVDRKIPRNFYAEMDRSCARREARKLN
jgi:hypothetical protein